MLKSIQMKNSLLNLAKFMFSARTGESVGGVGGNTLVLLYKSVVVPGGQFGKNPH